MVNGVWNEDFDARIRINSRRVRDGWGMFLADYPWEFFLTLTTDPRKYPRASESRLSRDVFRLCGQLSYLSRRQVSWAYAIEGGGGPALHAHVLTMNCTADGRRGALAGWQARCGKTHWEPVTSSARAAAYLCKSIGSQGEIVFSDSLRRSSFTYAR
jgi:hypothetical protein